MAKYIGRKPEEVGQCWGLLCLAYAEKGIELPSLPQIGSACVAKICSTVEKHAGEWEEVAEPFDGCAVGMSHSEAIHHVGIYAKADGGRIMHCNGAQSVVLDTLQGLRFKGYRTIRFYRHKLWPHT